MTELSNRPYIPWCYLAGLREPVPNSDNWLLNVNACLHRYPRYPAFLARANRFRSSQNQFLQNLNSITPYIVRTLCLARKCKC